MPIAVVILFSFNDPPGRFNFTWHKFSTAAWQHPFATPGIQDAVVLSLKIAFLSTIIATILGTLMALALARYSFRGRSVTNFVIFLPMATPEIVMGSSLLTLFISISFNRGFTTILIAHIMFNISYVVVTVKARIYGFDRRMEEAAMDLYANEFTTFRKITLPLIMPGVLAAAMLAFALSIDDFVITQFNAGPDITFPLFIYGAARTGVPGAGERDRLDDLPDRDRADGCQHPLPELPGQARRDRHQRGRAQGSAGRGHLSRARTCRRAVRPPATTR